MPLWHVLVDWILLRDSVVYNQLGSIFVSATYKNSTIVYLNVLPDVLANGLCDWIYEKSH